MSAPERIWAGDFDMGLGHCTVGVQGGLYEEYVLSSVAASQIAEAQAKIDVQRESKEYAQRCCEAAEAERDRLAAENAQLREALMPFNRICNLLDGPSPRGKWVAPLNAKAEGEDLPNTIPDDLLVCTFGAEFIGGVSLDGVMMGDLRRACNALAGKE